MAVQADTIDQLAELIGMDSATLEATIQRYNELAAGGVDLDFGKPGEQLIAIENGPFFALLYDTFITCGTFGGLKIDLYGRVINTEGNPIPGLFAAGEVANGQVLIREYGGSGTAKALYANLGRLAGRTAAGGTWDTPTR